eukprot:gene16896-18602_t
MMNQVAFKGSSQTRNTKDRSLPFQDGKGRQTLEDFKKFCNFILAYEATERAKCANSNLPRNKRPNSPSGSSGSSASTADSLENDDVKIPVKRKYAKHKSTQNEEYESDDESWSLVTCFCRKPFAGRPMIECSSCSIWIHLSCAKIRRSNIPELFICSTCRDKHTAIQIKPLVNGLEDRNNFASMKVHKSKTKRKSLNDENKNILKHTKERSIEEH